MSLFYFTDVNQRVKVKNVDISDLFETSRYKTIPKSMYFPFIINTLYHVILLTSDEFAFYLFVFFIITVL